MAGEQDEGTGGGAAGAGEGKQNAGEKPPVPAGGGAGERTSQPAGDAGGAGKPVGISPDVFPEQLRGKSEAELKFIMSNMVTSLQKQNQRIKELESKPAPKEEEKAPDPSEGKSYEERLLDDPEGVIAEIVQKRFGGVISNLEKGVGSSTLSNVRSEIDDFSEYEDDVLSLLEESGAPRTRENLLGAYTMAVGQRALQERRQQRQQTAGMESGGGAPQDDAGGKKIKMTDLEREIATAHGMSEEDFVKYRDEDMSAMIKVPTGKREKQNG